MTAPPDAQWPPGKVSQEATTIFKQFGDWLGNLDNSISTGHQVAASTLHSLGPRGIGRFLFLAQKECGNGFEVPFRTLTQSELHHSAVKLNVVTHRLYELGPDAVYWFICEGNIGAAIGSRFCFSLSFADLVSVLTRHVPSTSQ